MDKYTRFFWTLLIISLLFSAINIAGCIKNPSLSETSGSSDLVEEKKKVTNIQHESTPTAGILIPDNEEIPLRGIYLDPDQVNMHNQKIPYLKELRNLGVNSIQIVHWIEVDVDTGDVYDDIRTNPDETREWIELAHQAGLHVYLQLYPEYFSNKYLLEYGDLGPYMEHGDINFQQGDYIWRGELLQGQVKDTDRFYEDYKKIAIKWAEIAESLSVEMYSPVCELHNYMGLEKNKLLLHEILPILREMYHGELVQKGEIAWSKFGLTDDDSDLTYWADVMKGWDYVNADVFGDNVTFEQYPLFLEKLLSQLEELKTLTGARGIILGEVGIPEDSPIVIEKDYPLREVRIGYWTILLEKYIGKVDGFYFWGWQQDRSAPKVVTVSGKLPYSQNNELEGPLSLISLYYKKSDERRRLAYTTIHQLKRILIGIESLQKNVAQPITDWSKVASDLKEVSLLYSQGNFSDAQKMAEAAIANARKVQSSLLVESELAQIPTSLEMIKAASINSWVSETQINHLSQSAIDLLKSGNIDEALYNAKEAHRLVGMTWNDPEGDATKPDFDLTRVLFSEKDDQCLFIIELTKPIKEVTIYIEIDSNFDREKDLLLYARQDKNNQSEFHNAKGKWAGNDLVLWGLPISKPFAFHAYIIAPDSGPQTGPVDSSSPDWIIVE